MNQICLLMLAALIAGCGRQAEKQDDGHDHGTPTAGHQVLEKTVEGIASGYDCAVVDVLCPSTHRAADYTTGLFTEEKTFYFVVNIPQSFLTQYFLEKLAVTGRIYAPYSNAIEPEKIMHIPASGDRRLVYETGYFFDSKGHKSLFNQGRVVDGVWLCDQCAARK